MAGNDRGKEEREDIVAMHLGETSNQSCSEEQSQQAADAAAAASFLLCLLRS